MDILKIIKDGELINCGMFGCIYKFKLNNKYYCIKLNFRKKKIDYDEIYNKNLKNIETIPKKYFYQYYDAEYKIQKLLNKIEGKDINNKKLPFTIKIYNRGKITNKKLIKLFKKNIYQKYVSNNKHAFFINEFCLNINKCNEINYYIMDYVPNITLSNYIYDKNNNIKIKDIKELHTYYFYIVYYLYLINKVYDFRHDDLHNQNIILVNDEEYEKEKIKHRIIKINNEYYKIQIYQYRPYIIDFGFASIFNKNIINQKIEFYDDYNDFDNLKVINQQIKINKKNNLLNDLFKLSFNIYCNIKYNQIDEIINYFHKNKLNILELLFNYKKENINKINEILKKLKQNKDNSECNFNFYQYIYSKFNNQHVYNFINPFKLNKLIV